LGMAGPAAAGLPGSPERLGAAPAEIGITPRAANRAPTAVQVSRRSLRTRPVPGCLSAVASRLAIRGPPERNRLARRVRLSPDVQPINRRVLSAVGPSADRTKERRKLLSVVAPELPVDA